MTDTVALGNAVKTTLEADAWIGDAANVTTIEIHKRGFKIQDLGDALFFSKEDLPALAIVPRTRNKESLVGTTNELDETHFVGVVLVTVDRKVADGLDAHDVIIENIERVLNEGQASTLEDQLAKIREQEREERRGNNNRGGFRRDR